MNNTTTTNGQKPVYTGIRFEEQRVPTQAALDLAKKRKNKWLVLFCIAGIALLAFLMYFVYEQGKQVGTEKALQEQKKELERVIKAVTAEKKQDGIIEREKSKSSAERAQIIRKGIIRDLPVIKDTPREAKHEWIVDLTHKMKNKKD